MSGASGFPGNPGDDPRLSVVIPVHDNLDQTRECLASLSRQQAPFPFEVVVVDNGSGPETAAWLAGAPGIRTLRQERNLGYPGGVNVGVRAARGELVLVLNNDTLLPRCTLATLVGAFLGHDRVGLAAPSSDRVKGAQAIEAAPVGGDPGRAEEVGAWVESQYPGKVEDVPWLVGMALLIRRRLWGDLGGLDERFGLGNFEDDDLCLRVRALGQRLIVVRDAFIHHRGRTTFDSLGVDYCGLLQANRTLYLQKWGAHPVLAGELQLQAGRPQLALLSCRSALAEGRLDWEAFRVLAEALLSLNHPEEALRVLDQLLRLAPRHTQGALLRVLALMNLDREQEVRQAVARMLLDFYLDDRSAARLLALMAECCLEWRQPDEAAEYFRVARSLHLESPEALCGLATLALERGAREEAEELLGQAGEHVTALAMRAAMAWEEERIPQAKELFTAALHRNPRHGPSRHGLLALLPAGPELARKLQELSLGGLGEEFARAAEAARRGDLAEARSLLLPAPA